MLPVLDVSAGISTANVNTRQEYSNGNIVEQDGAGTDGVDAGLHFTWTLFDGMRMFATKSRLSTEEDASGLELKLQIENTVAGIMESYFRAVSLLEEIKVIEDAIQMFDERVRIAELRFQVGSGSKLDLLQSQTDRNARRSLRLQLFVNYQDAIANLNRLMGKDEFKEWLLTDSIVISYQPVLEDLRKSVMQKNYEIQLGQKQEEIFQHALNESRSYRLPVLDLNADYNYSRNENDVGFILLNRNQGFYSGLTLSWNIFNGFNTNREISNAKLNLNSTSLLLADTRSRIEHELYVAFNKFQSELEILNLEIENTAVATENVNVALESFRLGSISCLELKDAQNSYEGAQSRLVIAQLQAKLSEIELMRLNGELVK
jgi:outer membrane protein TolC